MVSFYHTHPSYNDYPVVNITYEGAENYCKWLTDKYNASQDRKFKKVLFRLPSESEWEYAAHGDSSKSFYPWGLWLRGQNGFYLCNFKRIGDENIRFDTLTKKYIVGNGPNFNDAADITCPVDSYKPNKLGLYNVCGNAAEMIKEKGILKGGNWKSAGGDVIISLKGHYKNSSV